MKRQSLYFIFTVIILFTGSTYFAQSAKTPSPQQFSALKDSLQNQKDILLANTLAARKELDSLKNVSSQLDDKIEKTLDEINQLYIKKFGRTNGNRILNKQVWKGMTDKMLRFSWGKPDKIEKNVEKWGVFTQWYYGDVTFFFRDGKLTEWEEKKP